MTPKLKSFSYKFNKGPLRQKDLKSESFPEGNCRLAIQYYLYKVHGKYFYPCLILNPRGFLKTGKFIVKEGKFDDNSFLTLKEGDVIYAENKDSKNKLERNDWIISLHSAIYKGNKKIWHSSRKAGGSAIWGISEFLKFYKPIATKRFI